MDFKRNNIVLTTILFRRSFCFSVWNLTYDLSWVHQDHSSQDHFCSLIDGFPVWNSEPDQPTMMRRASRPEREKVFMSSLVLVQNTLMIARFLSSTGSGGRSCRLSGSGRSIVGIYPSKYDNRSFQCPWVLNECLLSS